MSNPFDMIRKVLVIDNDPDWHLVVSNKLNEVKKEITVDYCQITADDDKTVEEAFDNKNAKIRLTKPEGWSTLNNYDLIFSDLYFAGHHGDVPDGALGGYKVLRKFDIWQQKFIHIPPVILLSGSYNLDRAIRLKEKFNTFDYLYKPEMKNISFPDFRKKEEWREKFADYFGLTEFMRRDSNLRSQVLATRRLVELYPEKFWFGYKVWEIVDHTKEHALGVWRILYDWLQTSPFLNSDKKLIDVEIFVLLMSALLHDIGSTGNEDFNDSLEVRFHHGWITSQILESEEYKIYGFKKNQKNLAKAVGLIAKYHDGQVPIVNEHNIDDFYEEEEERKQYRKLYCDYYGNMCFSQAWQRERLSEVSCKHRLLIALLMIADAMHINKKRTGNIDLAQHKVDFLHNREREYYLKKSQSPRLQSRDYDLIKEHIEFLDKKRQQDHYDKHSVIEKISFTIKPDEPEPHTLTFSFGSLDKPRFTVNYHPVAGMASKMKPRICGLIYKDLEYEWKRVGAILAKYWDGTNGYDWEILPNCKNCEIVKVSSNKFNLSQKL